MDSNSNLPVENLVNSHPVDLPCQDYDALCPVFEYLSSLESGMKSFHLPSGAEVKVTHDNIGKLRLFGRMNHLNTFLPSIYQEMKPKVESVMERVILFLLSQIVFGMLERSQEEHIYFSTHPVSEYGKIFWQDGEAVGFYTVKKKGSLCNGCTCQSYLLPVLDTVFVRRHWRRNGLAMQMLQDFCKSMPTERVLGISYPISPSMYGVCKKYLETHQEQRERLYEVEAPGNWSQRRNVWLSILVQHQPTHNASPHITRATDKRLIGNKGKKSMPRLTGTEPRCVEKQLTDRAETPQKCKKAKIS